MIALFLDASAIMLDRTSESCASSVVTYIAKTSFNVNREVYFDVTLLPAASLSTYSPHLWTLTPLESTAITTGTSQPLKDSYGLKSSIRLLTHE